jgi:branched-chain amino acid transport system ATP-binding protein
LLEVKGISVYYGVIPALRGLSLSVGRGGIVTLAGANGAGKTTTLKAVMGIHPPRVGSIVYKGEEISRMPADKRVEMGVALVPEGRQIFARLTVRDNLDLGAYHRKDREGIKRDLEWVHSLFPVLEERENQIAGTLSGGEQQMLALARGLMSHPELLMLDEPSLGLAPLVVRDIYRVIGEINRSGITILLVEQNINMAMKVASYAYILETGEIRNSGKPEEVMKKENIMKAYLGD